MNRAHIEFLVCRQVAGPPPNYDFRLDRVYQNNPANSYESRVYIRYAYKLHIMKPPLRLLRRACTGMVGNGLRRRIR
jgi:hypothetical protein